MKTIILLSTLVMALTACNNSSNVATAPFAADTAMTADEIAARRFTPEVMLKMGRLASSSLSSDGSTIAYTVTYMSVKENKSYTALWTMSANGEDQKQLTTYDQKVAEPAWSGDGTRIYFMSDKSGSNQLHSVAFDGSDPKQHSFEKAGVNGYGVSADGKNVWLAIDTKVDSISSADRFPDMEKSNALVYDDLMVRHWDTWEDGSYSHIYVGAMESDKVTGLKDIMPSEPWDAPVAPYFDNTEIAFNNAGSALAYTCRKLTGYQYSISTNTDIYLYNIEDGSTKNLTEGMMGYDKYPRFSPDDSQIAWQSMERAGNESDKDRLFVMNIGSGEKRYLTTDFDYNASNATWSADGSSLFFLSPIEATVQICRVDVATAKIDVITEGWHDYVSLSMAGSRVIAEKTTISMAAEVFSIDPIGGSDKQLTFINRRIYDNVDMGRVEKRMVATTDGQQMLTWVVVPPSFDSTASVKYPTLLYCQGGPQSVVSQAWSYRWNYQLMAAQGYIVVAPNRRGLPSFGQQWLDQISGDYSGQNIADLLSAIDDVSSEPYVDKERLGCVGASYGGYSVYYLAGKHEGRFKAFISHCGIFDFTSMYGETEELWFVNNDYGGAYWDYSNPVAMRSYANSPHNFVNNWDTPILIITGLRDFRIPYTQSLEAFTAARAHGVAARLVAFEDEAHQVFKAQNALVWNREFFGWLDQYLK